MKSKNILAEYVAHMGEVICVQILVGNLKGTEYMQDIGVDGGWEGSITVSLKNGRNVLKLVIRK